MQYFDETKVRQALASAWSLESAAQWSTENPANGQCNVTAAVIHNLFGGDILRTRLKSSWHYYNRINGVRVDFTDSQFSRPGARFAAPEKYDDELSDIASAMDGIPQTEYEALWRDFLKQVEVNEP